MHACSRRNSLVPQLQFWLLAGALGGLILGVLGVFLARGSSMPIRSSVGRLLYLGTLLALGGGGLLAAFHRTDGLVPLGLAAGFLVVAMFVESPQPPGTDLSNLPPPEEA
jgi:hypothetical protein